MVGGQVSLEEDHNPLKLTNCSILAIRVAEEGSQRVIILASRGEQITVREATTGVYPVIMKFCNRLSLTGIETDHYEADKGNLIGSCQKRPTCAPLSEVFSRGDIMGPYKGGSEAAPDTLHSACGLSWMLIRSRTGLDFRSTRLEYIRSRGELEEIYLQDNLEYSHLRIVLEER